MVPDENLWVSYTVTLPELCSSPLVQGFGFSAPHLGAPVQPPAWEPRPGKLNSMPKKRAPNRSEKENKCRKNRKIYHKKTNVKTMKQNSTPARKKRK